MSNQQTDSISVMRSDIEISLRTQKEYIAYHKQVDTDDLDRETVLTESERLFSRHISVDEKKRSLFSLAHIGELKAVTVLERYLKNSDPELTEWATLCFNECRMSVKSEELDAGQAIVMSGAGGDGTRLRFYFVVSTECKQPLTAQQKQTIKNGYGYETVASELRSHVESIEFGSFHVLFTVLIPVDVAPADFIERGIEECNKEGSFIRCHYYVTNTGKPTKKVIAGYLDALDNTSSIQGHE